jgi:hypothetical protein
LQEKISEVPKESSESEPGSGGEDPGDADYLAQTIQNLAQNLKNDPLGKELATERGKPYGVLQGWVAEKLPPGWDNPNNWAHHNLPLVLDAAFGQDGWESYSGPNKDGSKNIKWVRLRRVE